MPGSPRRVSTSKLPDPKTVFEQGLKSVFADDPVALNTLLGQMPLFLWALRDGTWSAVEGLIIQAKMSTLISQEQYDAIRQVSIETSAPITLPEEV